MITNSSTIVHRTSVHRIGILSVSMLAVGVLLSGCDRATPTEARAIAPNAAVADAYDHIGPEHGDESGVGAVAWAWDAAWNAGDSKSIGALFVDDAEFVNGRGQVAQGAATITANNTMNLAGVFKGSHSHNTIRNILFLSGTTAILNTNNELTGFKALPPGAVATSPGLLLQRHKIVVVKRGDVWRIVQMQLTSVAPTP
jgi:uncharacterized protein (TIGR02246 family)